MSFSEPEAEAIGIAPPTVSREAAQKVLDYLVFHRSLIADSEQEDPRLLERYLTLVERLKEGVHVVIPDPFQKATALLFELVMEQEFDPWEIDLVRFTQLYLDRVRTDGGVNFAVAGRLLYMAWSILYLQSEALLREREADETTAASEAPQPDLESGDYPDLVGSPEAMDVTSTVLGSADPPPLLEMVRHPETRPVTLLELVRAFDEAEPSARRALRLDELRQRLREEQKAPPEVVVHGEIPAQDLEDIWAQAMRRAKGEEFPLLSVWKRLEGRDRLVAVFLAVLFLAREKVLDLRQATLGEGPIVLARLEDERHPVIEETK